ncbi:DUF2971 domain-containing protein [Cellvibrio sp. pealriver]|uniref:DUF2971 domain-containing protein n=1 Tax=Cellvibrio sp. pealriver TaxID=1622269 RepID=UPI00066FC782|nr:DUF2971 domain-containing protein [Cellvibrio sp. pealriver]
MKVYRFEKNTEERLQTILDGSIYLSTPESFNDLDDCRIKAIYTPNFDEKSYNQVQACIETLYDNEDSDYFPLPKEILTISREFLSYGRPREKNIKDHLKANFAKASIVRKIRDYLRKTTGICCFFKGAPIHPLMWAHYAAGHTGFCIEYDIDDIDHPLEDVNYTTRALTPSINELLFCPHETFTEILTTKSLEWSYEKESRLIYLGEFQNEERGKKIPLPETMKPSRLIKGEKFDSTKNTSLIENLNIPTVLYKKFVNQHSSSEHF